MGGKKEQINTRHKRFVTESALGERKGRKTKSVTSYKKDFKTLALDAKNKRKSTVNTGKPGECHCRPGEEKKDTRELEARKKKKGKWSRLGQFFEVLLSLYQEKVVGSKEKETGEGPGEKKDPAEVVGQKKTENVREGGKKNRKIETQQTQSTCYIMREKRKPKN